MTSPPIKRSLRGSKSSNWKNLAKATAKMITIFAMPKAFRGHIDVIQRNAIMSWTRLSIKPEIILLGTDEGTAEVAREFGVRHLPEVARNPEGTPLVSDLFAQGQRCAANDLLCYV